MMTDRCNDLDLFFDRELEAAAADAFRDHLAGCASCQDGLEGRMLEAARLIGEPMPMDEAHDAGGYAATTPEAIDLHFAKQAPPVLEVARAPEAGPAGAGEIARGARRGARRLVMTAAIAASAGGFAAAAVSTWLLTTPAAPALPQAAAPLLSERQVEVRFSSPELDRHRRFLVVRGTAPAPREQIDLRYLSALEARRDWNTLAGAHALIGELSSAAQTLAGLAPGANHLSDLAAIELL
ncbi:MAG TPA: zf-HC2 domain-containing protein, partial [Kofleriaceae bacterium]